MFQRMEMQLLSTGVTIGDNLLHPFLPFSSPLLYNTMRIVVTTETDAIYNLEIDSQMAIEDLKALLETEVHTLQRNV